MSRLPSLPSSQTLSISNYQLGEPLGKGASASVFKALNFNTGETVAIKQISLSDVVGKEELREIMSEIELLKNLNHENIVEYKGFERNEESLFIILEYCENGSLASFSKRYGRLPEDLVAGYTAQVLSGLIYLHSQGVIHRDIKGANILTNKNGQVKLADFGVATVMDVAVVNNQEGGFGTAADGDENGGGGNGGLRDWFGEGKGKVKIGVGEGAVVGSPYWMAPEVIEQNGATSASDIWSLGCVVIELLEGRPPYYSLDPMQALFRIVQDDGPPVPESAGMLVKDFLGQCFQKDPNLRTSATQLLKHPWMLRAAKREEFGQPAPHITSSSSAYTLPPSDTSSSMASLASAQSQSDLRTTRMEPASNGDGSSQSGLARQGLQPSQSRPQVSRSISSATPVRIKPSRRPSSGLNPATSALGLTSKSSDGSLLQPATSGSSSSLHKSTNHSQKGKERAVESYEGMTTPMKVEGSKIRVKRPVMATEYDKAVQKVQEWNVALATVTETPAGKPGSNSSEQPRILRRKRNAYELANTHLLPSKPAKEKEKENMGSDGMLESSSGESLAKHLAALTPSRYKFRMIGTEEQMEVLKEEAKSDWDDDFAETVNVSRLRQRTGERENTEMMKTIMPKRSASDSSSSTSLSRRVPSTNSIADEDGFDDLDMGDERSLSDKIRFMKSKMNKPGSLLRIDDVPQIGVDQRENTVSSNGSGSSAHIPPSPSRRLISDVRPRPRLASPPSRANLTPTASSRTISGRLDTTETGDTLRKTELDLQKYAESDEDEAGFEDTDIFVGNKATPRPTDSLRLSTIRTNRSLDDTQTSDLDPFAQIEDSLDESQEDHLRREKHAMLCSRVTACVDALRPELFEREVEGTSQELLALLEDNADLQQHFVSVHGLQAVLEILEMTATESVTVPLLDILCISVCESDSSLDNFCLIGGAAIVLEFCSDRHSEEARLQSLFFVHRLISYPAGLAILTSCGGLRVLIRILKEEYDDHKELASSVIAAIHHITTVQKGSSKVDLCRSLAREGLLDILPELLRSVSQDASDEANELQASLADIILIFCQGGQTDSRLRDAVGTSALVKSLLDFVIHLCGVALTVACKAIKCLCSNPLTMDKLQNSGGIGILVKILEQHLHSSNTNEICSQVFQALYSLCRLSTTRQEEAAQEGVLPLLVHVIRKGSPLKAWALPIFCDLAAAGRRIRKLLWSANALPLYVDLMKDPYWRILAFDAIVHWLTEEMSSVEPALLKSSFSDLVVRAFVDESGGSFERILNPLLKLFRTSKKLASACGSTLLYRRITDTLAKDSKPVIKLNLMKAVKMLGQYGFPGAESSVMQDLKHTAERLARKDDAILVRKLADELVALFPPKPRAGGHSRSRSILEQSTRQEMRAPASTTKSTRRLVGEEQTRQDTRR